MVNLVLERRLSVSTEQPNWSLLPHPQGSGTQRQDTFCCRKLPPGNGRVHLGRHKTQPCTQHMTRSQDNAAVVLREKQNKTPRIKFSNTSVSRLHVSHLSIIYRRPQRDVAELVLAGGSKLRSRKERQVQVECRRRGAGFSGSLGGQEEEGLVTQSLMVVEKDSLEGHLLPRACDLSIQGRGRPGWLAATSLSLRMWSQRVVFFLAFP